MQLSRTIVVLLAAFAASPVAAEDFSGEATFPWLAVGTTYMIETGRPYFAGAFSGITIFKDGAGPLHNSAIQCPGYNDIGVDAAGYCTITATDGDKVFLKWSCKGTDTAAGDLATCEGASEIYGGTGKFDGATGGNDFTAHVVGVHPDGTTSGWSELRNYKLSY